MFPSHLIHAIGGHMAELTHLNCFQTIPPWTRDHWSRWHREISCSPSFCTTWSIWWSAQPSCPRGERLKFHDFGWFRLISCISGVDMLMIDQWSAQSKWVPDRACNSYTVIYIYTRYVSYFMLCIRFDEFLPPGMAWFRRLSRWPSTTASAVIAAACWRCCWRSCERNSPLRHYVWPKLGWVSWVSYG